MFRSRTTDCHPFPTFDIRTDLAVEATEKHPYNDSDTIPGVSIEHQEHCNGSIHLTRVTIQTEEGVRALGKSIGTYITLETAPLGQNDGESHRQVSRLLAKQLQDLIQKLAPGTPPSILAVGLGNGDVTPDALGPHVLGHLLITRHLRTGQFTLPTFSADAASVCGIVPGVMAQTGMETAEIIKALTDQLQPDLILAVDALAARSVSRLGTTIQLTDTGIHPGSGVGNHRHSLTRDSLGVPVIAIGVPTVVSAAAIVADTLDTWIDLLSTESDSQSFAHELLSMSPNEKYDTIHQLLAPRFGPMFVTPKDIDETVKRISFTVSEGINIALFGEQIPHRS